LSSSALHFGDIPSFDRRHHTYLSAG
jgi:hypothetical protein